MKIIIRILIFTLSVSANTESSASNTSVLGANLETFEIAHDQFAGVNTGSIQVDNGKHEIRLRLEDAVQCEPGQACIALAPKVYSVTLPIVDSYTDGCGSEVYVAEEDKRAVDGNFRALKVADHSTMLCEIVLNYLSEVELTTISARGNILTQSYFTGGEFQLVVPQAEPPNLPTLPPVIPFEGTN